MYDPQLGYGFSLPHCISYSLIALQELNLAYHYPIVYWNCGCLCINAGAAENTDEVIELKDNSNSLGNIEDIEKSDVFNLGADEEDLNPIIDTIEDYPDEEIISPIIQKGKEDKKKKKVRSTDYGKIATALNELLSKGVKIVPPDINRSKFDFKPNAKENEIVYSLKSIDRIGDSLIEEIVKGQPYESINDFVNRIKVNRTQLINLIKAGVFDNISSIPKRQLLYNYIASITDLKSNLTLSNVPLLLNEGLLTNKNLDKVLEKYLFNKQLRSKQSKEDRSILILENDDIGHIKENYSLDYPDLIQFNGERYYVLEKQWKKIYDREMDELRDFINLNKEDLLKELNNRAIKENLLKYAIGSESEWEMKSISFYYSGHELSNIDRSIYAISNFADLPESPEVSLFTQWKGQPYPIYKLNTIAGTVIGKNKLRHTVAILTADGVVYVKFYADMFSFFDKQISERNKVTGKRKVMEKGWFTRGNKILVTGIRRGDQFIPKTYRSTPIKQLYLIKKVNKDGTLVLQDSRYTPEEE